MRSKIIQDNILFWGFGREARAMINYLYKEKDVKNFFVYTDQEVERSVRKKYKGISFFYRNELKDLLKLVSKNWIIFKSPGISLYREDVNIFKEKGAEISSQTQFSLSQLGGKKVIVVSGTKGKSTTASLLGYILNCLGKRALVVGNIGVPIIEKIDEAKKMEFVIVELSSYQIADLDFSPKIFLLTNLYPEHKNWHRTHKQYFKDKTRLIRNSKGVVIINAESNKLVRSLCPDANPSFFNSKNGFYGEDASIFLNGKSIGKLNNINLSGQHNLVNISAALEVINRLGCDFQKGLECLSNFRGLPHRQKCVYEDNSIKFIDDSLATIPEATIAAVNRFSGEKITLIVGGFDRGQEYSQLLDVIIKNNSVINVLGIPATGNRIIKSLKRKCKCKNKKFLYCSGLKEAVKKAKKITPLGGIVLMSPGAASFGYFSNYHERGAHFLKFAKEQDN